MINKTFEKYVIENKGKDEAVFDSVQRAISVFEDSITGIRQGAVVDEDTEEKVKLIFVVFSDLSVIAFLIFDDSIGIELLSMQEMYLAFMQGKVEIDGLDVQSVIQQAAEMQAEAEKLEGVTIN